MSVKDLMANSSGPTLETVVQEAFRVGAQVVLSSRVYQADKPTVQAPAKRKSWFNLVLDEVESANKALEPWKRDVGRPLVLEVFLRPWGTAGTAFQHCQATAPVETVLETWVFHYQPCIMAQGPTLSRSQLSRLNPSSIYKRLIIMLRSLFCYVRVLPAYRMFRVCKRQRGSNFTIGYRLSGTLPKRPVSSSPLPVSASSRSSEARSVQQYEFMPVDTPYGKFKITVDYQPASRVTLLEQTTSPPPLPQIISNYVGGVRPPGQVPLRPAVPASIHSQEGSSRHLQARSSGSGVAVSVGRGGLQRQTSGFTPLPRHSWSSSAMRISPNRLASPQLQRQNLPLGQELTPYGSAPQMGPLHSPQLLRTLSSKTSGTPPRCRPPLPPQFRGLEGITPPTPGQLNGRPIPQGRLHSSGQHVRSEDDREGDEQFLPGSSNRQSSAPVSIPGCSPKHSSRRLRSSGDLWSMHQASEQQKPLSAPAVSHLQHSREDQPEQSPAGGTGATALPLGALPSISGIHLESESSGSAASSSLFPTSCSPQLPFAFTPSAQSLASYGSKGPLQEIALERISPRLRTASSSAGAAAGALQQAATSASPSSWGTQGRGSLSPAGTAGAAIPPPGSRVQGQHVQFAEEVSTMVVTGREVSTTAVLARRQSWSGRSSTSLRKSSLEGVGYSVSPMQDLVLESVLGGSTPSRQYSFGVPTPQYGTVGLVRPSLSRTSSNVSTGAAPPLLTYHTPAAENNLGSNVGQAEPDVLPFALEGYAADGPLLSTQPSGFGSPTPLQTTSAARLESRASPAKALAGESSGDPPAGGMTEGCAASSDAAVGALVRLLQEAPPLRQCYTGREGWDCGVNTPGLDGGQPAPGARAGEGPLHRMTLQTGLRQLELIKERLQSQASNQAVAVDV